MTAPLMANPVSAPGLVDDAALWRGVQAGDDAAIAVFIRRGFPACVFMAARCVAHGTRPEDFAWDVLVDVVMALRGTTTPAPANVRGYLARSVQNRWSNERRSRARFEDRRELAELGTVSEASRRASEGGPFDDAPSSVWEPSRASVRTTQRAAALERALTADELQIVAWRADGVPFPEIAERAGCTHNAARVRMTRLRRRLRGVVQ